MSETAETFDELMARIKRFPIQNPPPPPPPLRWMPEEAWMRERAAAEAREGEEVR